MSMLTYDKITLTPRVLSDVPTRDQCDTSLMFCGIRLELPLLSAPMPDISGGRFVGMLAKLGGMGFIYRQDLSIAEQLAEYKEAESIAVLGPNPKEALARIGCAIGIKDDMFARAEALYKAGCRIFCLDTANGFHTGVTRAAFDLKVQFKGDIKLVAGNVATHQGYAYLRESGVINAVRVGIAGGSVCETKTETGVHMPTIASVAEIIALRVGAYGPEIIADGGVRTPADVLKAIVFGAHVAMAGNIFAGYEETPGEPQTGPDGKLYKMYRGAASFSVKRDSTGQKPRYVEGRETMVPYVDKSIEVVVKRFKEGFQSSMSYFGARNWDEFRENVSWEVL